MFWVFLPHFDEFKILGFFAPFWTFLWGGGGEEVTVLGCSLTVLGCIGLYWAALGLYRAALGYIGLY